MLLGIHLCFVSFQLQDFYLLWSSFQLVRLTFSVRYLVSHYPSIRKHWFRLFPLRSPLLGESLLFSLPLATKMFQFTRFAHHYFRNVFLGLPHSDTLGSLSASDSPRLFVGCYVLLRLCVPRYPPSALSCLTCLFLQLRLFFSMQFSRFLLNNCSASILHGAKIVPWR